MVTFMDVSAKFANVVAASSGKENVMAKKLLVLLFREVVSLKKDVALVFPKDQQKLVDRILHDIDNMLSGKGNAPLNDMLKKEGINFDIGLGHTKNDNYRAAWVFAGQPDYLDCHSRLKKSHRLKFNLDKINAITLPTVNRG